MIIAKTFYLVANLWLTAEYKRHNISLCFDLYRFNVSGLFGREMKLVATLIFELRKFAEIFPALTLNYAI